MDRKKMSNRYNDRIEQLENEVKEIQQEIEITNKQSTIDKLEEDIYNTEQSIKELKKYV
jgi:peptidoglycan hydrolase CwlO-like protein